MTQGCLFTVPQRCRRTTEAPPVTARSVGYGGGSRVLQRPLTPRRQLWAGGRVGRQVRSRSRPGRTRVLRWHDRQTAAAVGGDAAGRALGTAAATVCAGNRTVWPRVSRAPEDRPCRAAGTDFRPILAVEAGTVVPPPPERGPWGAGASGVVTTPLRDLEAVSQGAFSADIH